MTLNPLLADIVGLCGGACFVAAYAYSNLAKQIDFLFFNILNLTGALLMVVSLSVHFNLASMVLELVWSVVALFGIAKAIWGRHRA